MLKGQQTDVNVVGLTGREVDFSGLVVLRVIIARNGVHFSRLVLIYYNVRHPPKARRSAAGNGDVNSAAG